MEKLTFSDSVKVSFLSIVFKNRIDSSRLMPNILLLWVKSLGKRK